MSIKGVLANMDFVSCVLVSTINNIHPHAIHVHTFLETLPSRRHPMVASGVSLKTVSFSGNASGKRMTGATGDETDAPR